MGMMTEFKEFAMRGNVVDLAVGVVIGAAFGKIVTALVDKVIMPPIGLLIGGVNFAKLAVVLKEASVDAAGKEVPAVVLVKYGAFINALIEFLIIAFAIFVVVKAINRLAQGSRERSTGRAERRSAAAARDPRFAEALTADFQHIRTRSREPYARGFVVSGTTPCARTLLAPPWPCWPPCPLHAQQATRIDDAAMAQRRHAARAALADDTGWKVVESLTTEVGPRLAGSEADARAVAWAQAKFKALGYDKVWTEPVTFPKWQRRSESRRSAGAHPQPLMVTALGGSAGRQAWRPRWCGSPTWPRLKRPRPDQPGRQDRLRRLPHGSARRTAAATAPAARAQQRPVGGDRRAPSAVVIRSVGTDNASHPAHRHHPLRCPT